MSDAKRPVSVLIVEDNDDIRESLAELLEDAGYVAAMASNGRVALDLVRTVSPELILLDLSMPVLDGPQFRAAQLADPDIAAIPVVVLSAAGDAAEKAAAMGVASLLPKPTKLQDLLDTVARYCSKRP